MTPCVIECVSCRKPFLLSTERTQQNRPQVCVHCQFEHPIRVTPIPGMVSYR